jgi:predicted nucleic acid-binding protein
MAVRVVDASAVAALLFGEPEADTIATQLDNVRLLVPSLLGFELANVCLIKMRRHPEQREALRTAFDLYEHLGLEEVTVDHAGVLDVAETTGLTAYDASYLWLARMFDAELVTLDRQLAKAAKA